MKAKFLLSSLLVALLGAQLSAISYDFNVGYGFGFDYGLRTAPKDLDLGPVGSIKATDISQFTWSTGGFVGGGVSFEGDFTQSVGLEYTGKYIANNQKYTYKFPVAFGGRTIKADIKVEAMDNFLDIYYKVGLMKTIPMDLQINAGLVTRLLVGTTIGGEKVDAKEPPVAFGFHAGLRYNVHMFFLGVDYSYIPSYNYPKSTADLLGTYPGVSSAKKLGFNDHSVSVSMGVILNKAILDSFTK